MVSCTFNTAENPRLETTKRRFVRVVSLWEFFTRLSIFVHHKGATWYPQKGGILLLLIFFKKKKVYLKFENLVPVFRLKTRLCSAKLVETKLEAVSTSMIAFLFFLIVWTDGQRAASME